MKYAEVDAFEMDDEVVVVMLSRWRRKNERRPGRVPRVLSAGTRLPNHSLSGSRNFAFWSLLSARERQDHYAKFVARACRVKQQLPEREPITVGTVA